MSDVTQILDAIARGEQQASDQLLPLVYDELRRLAVVQMAAENPGHTLQATALVHEAYVRLVGSEQEDRWTSRRHFFNAAAEAMRRILIDNARRKARLKRGGDLKRIDLSDAQPAEPSKAAEELIALDEALQQFRALHPDKAELVTLRYFAGLSEQEAADVLGISRATASRHWSFARAWLFDKMA